MDRLFEFPNASEDNINEFKTETKSPGVSLSTDIKISMLGDLELWQLTSIFVFSLFIASKKRYF